MTRVEIVDDRVVALARGRQAFRDGSGEPPDTWTDRQWRGRLNADQAFRLGWQAERGLMAYRAMTTPP